MLTPRDGLVAGLIVAAMAMSPDLPTTKTTLQSDPDSSVVSLQQTKTVLYQEQHPSITRFNSSYTYTYPSNNSVEELHIYGYEPTVGTGFPVYIHAGGFGDRFPDDVPEMRLAEEMAKRGFVSAIIEMPSRDFLQFRCDGHEDSLINISRRLYSYSGPGDPQSTATATMCRRSKADCAAGLALHGLSISGMICGIAPRFAHGVTAELRWASGVFVPGGHTDCGRFGGPGYSANYSACEPDPRTHEFQPPGGSDLECVRNSETSRYLPSSRRRLINAHNDPEYGDYSCFLIEPTTGTRVSMPPLRNCNLILDAPDAGLNQSRLASGRDCGEDSNCIALDGSGYYIVDGDQVGGFQDSTMQGHNFHVWMDESIRDPSVPPQHTHDYYISPNWTASEEPWGMNPSFDWLAATARRPL